MIDRIVESFSDIAKFDINRIGGAERVIQCIAKPHIGAAGLSLGIIGEPGDWTLALHDSTKWISHGDGSDEALEQLVWAASLGAQRWEWRGRNYWALGGVASRVMSGEKQEERSAWAPMRNRQIPAQLLPFDAEWCTARRPRGRQKGSIALGDL